MNILTTSTISIATKSAVTGLLIMGASIGYAHSALSIQEKEPEASIVNQYTALKNADASSPALHQLITELNQRVSINPNDSLAWELLAQIYYHNGYHAYAVYAASEAIQVGNSTDKMQKILLNSSAIVSKSQLQADYLTDEVDENFLKEYQHALSKIYGTVHGFNYDESLPKPVAPVVRPRAAKVKVRSKASRSSSAPKKVKAAPKRKKVAPLKSRPAPIRQAPTQKPSRPTPAKSSGSSTPGTDPFKILR